jgi:hypothetical protein
MESQPFRTNLPPSVFTVPDDGMPLFCKMDANLVFPAGQEMDLHQAESLVFFTTL